MTLNCHSSKATIESEFMITDEFDISEPAVIHKTGMSERGYAIYTLTFFVKEISKTQEIS